MFVIIEGLNSLFSLFLDQIVESVKIEGTKSMFSLWETITIRRF